MSIKMNIAEKTEIVTRKHAQGGGWEWAAVKHMACAIP